MSTRTATRPLRAAELLTAARRPPAPADEPDTELDDPAIASDGMTIDTPRSPVDLVAIERTRAGHPVELSAAEIAYLHAHPRPREPLTEAQEHRAP